MKRRLLGDGSGAGTVYIEDVQLVLGSRSNHVPIITAQRQWATTGNVEIQGSAAPVTGTWKVGDIVWNTAPVAGGVVLLIKNNKGM